MTETTMSLEQVRDHLREVPDTWFINWSTGGVVEYADFVKSIDAAIRERDELRTDKDEYRQQRDNVITSRERLLAEIKELRTQVTLVISKLQSALELR